MSRAVRTMATAVLLAAAFSAAGQPNPDIERGMRPGLAYRVDGLDHTNLFNGTVTVNIPLGQTYTINDTLSYSFTASYATNAWDTGYHTVLIDGGVAGWKEVDYDYQYPAAYTNAGFGWMVTLGHMKVGDDGLLYVAPDGSQHKWYDTLHASDPADSALVFYTRDGTYLRYTRDSSTGWAGTVEFPGGETHTFNGSGSLIRIDDRFGNWVAVSYGSQTSANQDFNNQPLWTISDSLGREHRIYFRRSWRYYETLWGTETDHSVVDRVELEAFAGATATYQFNYDAPYSSDQPPPAASRTSRRCTSLHDPETPEYIHVPILRSIDMPEGVEYTLTTDRGDGATCSETAQGGISGNLTHLGLPTGGTIDWTYQVYRFPAPNGGPFGNGSGALASVNAGVKSRTTNVGGRTEYEVGKVDPADLWSDLIRTVKNFDGVTLVNQTRHYFGGCRKDAEDCLNGRTQGEYGLPFSRTKTVALTTQAGEGFLSTEFDIFVDGTPSTQRRSFVRYEHDSLQLHTGEDRNARIAYERTVYLDDAARYADTKYTLFDGLGHYRKAVTGGDFFGENSRTTFTNYNPSAGTFALDGTGNFTMLAATSPWILNTFDREWTAQTVTRVGRASAVQVAEARTCFDPATGFLTSRRVYKNHRSNPDANPILNAGDLLAVFGRETVSGRLVLTEKHYLGETTYTCGSAAPAGEEYSIRSEYENGARARSWYVDENGTALTFRITDLVIDLNTGLPSKSYRFRTNTSGANDGVSTTFSYDLLGRPKVLTTPTAEVTHVYSLQPAKITTTEKDRGNGAVLRSSSVQFDAFGRVTKETRGMPGGVTASRETAYNGMGWATSVTDWGASAALTTKYDAFGRPVEIRPPDQNDTTATYITYTGVSETQRKAKVAASGPVANPGYHDAITTQRFDRHGRLIEVTEPAPSAGGSRPTTEYVYDQGDRLVQVCANKVLTACGQERNFVYDGRGFLSSETHPESATTSYTYDSRGHVLRRNQSDGVADVLQTYDRAERLETVDEKVGSTVRPLKRFFFGTANTSGSKANGQLEDAVRYNWLANGYAVQVRETYTYGDSEGRPTKRRTRDYACVPGPSETCTSLYVGTQLHDFEQTFAYDPLGLPKTLEYPRCLLGGCTETARTVQNTYSQGFLTAVTSGTIATSIAYHDSGLPRSIGHDNNVVDTQAVDLRVPSRPLQITTSNIRDESACVAPSFTQQPQSVTISSGSSAMLQAAAVGEDGYPITFTWYRGIAPSRTNPVGTGATVSVQPTTTTSYWVEARNACTDGVTESQTATVTVCTPPAINPGPRDETVTRGQTVDVGGWSVSGTEPFSYQWYTVTGGVATPIEGATQRRLYVTPTETTTYRLVVTNACDSAEDDATVTVVDPPTVPLSVSARYDQTAARVIVTWSASTSTIGLQDYIVTRQPDNRTFTALASSLTYHDTTALVADKAYSYTVRARDANSALSEMSTPDFAVVATFAEEILDPAQGGTLIRGSHVSELRKAVDALRALAGLAPAWSSYAPATGVVSASDWIALRDRLNDARGLLGAPPVVFTDAVATGQRIRGRTVRELRGGVQ